MTSDWTRGRKVRLFPGQIVIREDLDADYRQYSHIVVPQVGENLDRRRTWHRGKVLAMGPIPEFLENSEMHHFECCDVMHGIGDYGFHIGSDVIFHWEHSERNFTRPWIDGKMACWVPWRLVDAVIEEAANNG